MASTITFMDNADKSALQKGIDLNTARIAELAAMRGTGGVTEYSQTVDWLSINICSNGAVAHFTCSILYGEHSIFQAGGFSGNSFSIPSQYMPATSVVNNLINLSSGHPDMKAELVIQSDGTCIVSFYNHSDEEVSVGGHTFDAHYGLRDVCVPELSDMRVGRDGTVYDTAKAAIDSQFEDVYKLIENLKNNGTGGGGVARISYVDLLASGWQGTKSPYSQVVAVEGATANSQVDLTPSVDQLTVFHNKDLAFVTENEDGVVTVYAIGQKPTNDYTIQVTITEVVR